MSDSFSFVNIKREVTRRKNKARSTVIPNPIFLTLKENVDDAEWVSHFEDFANDIFPRGFHVHHDPKEERPSTLVFKKGRSDVPLFLEGDAEELAQRVIRFFHEHHCLYSKKDKHSLQKKEVPVERKWRNFKAFEKQQALQTYVQEFAIDHKLKAIQIDDFHEQIFEGIDDGSIKPNRIILDGSRIVEISGVEYDADEQEFSIKLTAKRKNKASTSKKSDPIVKDWEKALTKVQKLIKT
jgi:hypothetical protein